MPLLDLILDYDCNLSCDYCTISPAMRQRSVSPNDALLALRQGIEEGFDGVSFTGGEPTIRKDLLALVRKAKDFGYARIKVQTNGLLLAEVKNAQRLRDAGANILHISIHAHQKAPYDALVAKEGAFELMERAVRNASAIFGKFEVDLILKQDTLAQIPAAIAWLADRNVSTVNLWLVSLTDHNENNLASAVSFGQAAPILKEAFAVGTRRGMDVRSLHVPPCMLVGHEDRFRSPVREPVRVVTPDAVFDLKDSKLTGQRHVEACLQCPEKGRCPGLRDDYLDLYGDHEVAEARGLPPSIMPKRRLPTC